MLRKDVLSPKEIQKLAACHYDNENPNVRRAFIFCLYCGLRFCDVKDLTYKNVDYANRLLKFEQSKTKGHSASSGVVIPLNEPGDNIYLRGGEYNVTEDWIMDKSGNKTYAKVFDIKQKGNPSSPICVIGYKNERLRPRVVFKYFFIRSLLCVYFKFVANAPYSRKRPCRVLG